MKKATCFILLILFCLPLFSCIAYQATSSEVEVENSTAESVAMVQIDLPDEKISLAVGRSYQLEPVISGSAGNKDVFYTSQREQVATVDSNGLVVAKRAGDTQIIVSVGDVNATLVIAVEHGANAIKLSVNNAVLTVGDELILKAEALPENIIDDEVFFRSKNEAIATVDDGGKIIAVAAGEVDIEAYTANETTSQCTVTVRPKVDSIKLDKLNIELKVGDKASLSATILPENALVDEIIFSSDDPEIADIDDKFIITAKKIGTTKIIVSAGGAKAECTIIVTETPKVVEVTKVSLSQSDSTLYEGETLTLAATVTPSNANDKRITYTSSDSKVASVDSSGVVKAVKKGTATITASAKNGVKASIKITVNEVPKIAKPAVINYVYTESAVAVLMGTCEMGAVIKAKYDGIVATTNSDHGYFTLRIKSGKSQLPVEITAQVAGGESEVLTYQLVKKAPITDRGSAYWQFIPGDDMQFHMHGYNYLDDYMRRNSFSASQLNTYKARINSKVAAIRNVNPNAELIYMVIPSAATIYPETMPEYYTPLNNKSRLEQLYEVIEDSDAVLIDLKTAFQAHKNDDLKLYWKTDTHWTDYGAYVAYTELFNYIKTQYPSAAPRAKSEFNFVEDYYEMGDVAENLGLRSQPLQIISFKEYNALRVPKFDMPSSITSLKRFVSDRRLTYTPGIMDQRQHIKTNRTNLPSAVMLRDSYSAQIFDIMAERFDQTLFKPMWDYSIRTNELNLVDADYVIVLVVERNLSEIVK